MSAKSAHLTLRPERCTQCGMCVRACPHDAVRIGDGYILIDWNACQQCCNCVSVCESHAIAREVVPLRSSAASPVTPDEVSKVVVGSRAEAKALRKAADKAAKQAGKPAGRGGLSVIPGLRSAKATEPAAPQPQVVATVAAPSPDVDVTPAPSFSTPVASAAAQSTAAPSRRTRVGSAQPTSRTTAVLPALRLGDVEWGPVDVGAVLAALLLTILGKNALLAIPAISLMPAAGRTATRAVVLALYYAIQLGVLIFLAGRHGSSLPRAFGLRRTAEHDARSAQPATSALGSAGMAVALLVGVEVFAIGYGLIAQAVGWRQPLSLSTDVASVFGAGGVGLALSAVLVALVAPFIEELAFRGVVLSALGERWGMWPGIVVSSLLFAAYHVNAWLFLPMLVFGIALGWLTWTRRSIWPAIALHVVYNGLAVTAAFLVPR